jgi:hypothetical protein
LAKGVVTLDQMKLLTPFMTAGGDVYRAQLVGYFDGGNASARAEVVCDAATNDKSFLRSTRFLSNPACVLLALGGHHVCTKAPVDGVRLSCGWPASCFGRGRSLNWRSTAART